MAAPSVLALLTTSARDDAERNRALALFGAVSSGGASIGLLLGGLLTDVASWRWTLFINVPIGIAVLVLAPMFVTETPRRAGRFDIVGAVSATVGAVSIVWALIGTPDHGWTSGRTVGGLVVGAIALVTLAITERRVAHPMIQPSLLRNRTRVAALAMMALVVGAQLSMFFLVVQYVQRVLGFGPLASGFRVPALQPGDLHHVAVHAAPDRPVRPAAARGHGGHRADVRLRQAEQRGRRQHVPRRGLPADAARRAGGALCFMPITATVLFRRRAGHAGAASGMLQTTQQLGSAVGVAVIVSVFATHAVPGQFLPGAHEAFLTWRCSPGSPHWSPSPC